MKPRALVVFLPGALVLGALLRLGGPLAHLADPLLVVALVAALPGRTRPALLVGLVAGLLDDAAFGKWFGCHALVDMTLAYGLALLAGFVDLGQALPRAIAIFGGSLAAWGLELGLVALFDLPPGPVPGPGTWLAMAAVNAVLGVLLAGWAARRGWLD